MMSWDKSPFKFLSDQSTAQLKVLTFSFTYLSSSVSLLIQNEIPSTMVFFTVLAAKKVNLGITEYLRLSLTCCSCGLHKKSHFTCSK